MIDWVSGTFDTTENMAGLEWGRLYEDFHNVPYDRIALNARVNELLQDESIRRHSNIYEYVLGGEKNPNLLEIRIFEESTKGLFTIDRRNMPEKMVFRIVLCVHMEMTIIVLVYIN